MALRNLPSEIVDKIQVFDRLSDQAQLLVSMMAIHKRPSILLLNLAFAMDNSVVCMQEWHR